MQVTDCVENDKDEQEYHRFRKTNPIIGQHGDDFLHEGQHHVTERTNDGNANLSVLVGLSVLRRPPSRTSSRCTDNTSKSSHPRTMSLLGVPEFSAFPPVFVYFHADTADWSQTKPVRDSALAWTVWPSGRSDSKHRLAANTRRSTFRPEKSSLNLEKDATIAASKDF